jgi:hypothetical protein
MDNLEWSFLMLTPDEIRQRRLRDMEDRLPPTIPPPLLYQSPSGSGSNDGALPTHYDPKWQLWTNLTKEQIEKFQSFPQWQAFVKEQGPPVWGGL